MTDDGELCGPTINHHSLITNHLVPYLAETTVVQALPTFGRSCPVVRSQSMTMRSPRAKAQ